MNPKLIKDPVTKQKVPYGPYKYKLTIKELFIISKNTNTSYTDLRDKLTPAEKDQLLLLIKEEDDKNKEHLKKLKEQREAKRNERGRGY